MSVIDCKWMIANLLEKVGCLSEERLSAGTKYRLMGVVADIIEATELLTKEVLERVKQEAVLDADALLLLTEWKEFRLPTWGVIKRAMRRPLVIDGRNIFDVEELQENGFEYHCIGRE